MVTDTEKNRRQVPKTKEYLSSKDYCDYLYCHLQVISQYDSERKIRYLDKKDINFTNLGTNLNKSRQTISSKFKKLEKLGLIRKYGEGWELITLENTLAELLPFSTLRLLVNTMREHTISTYIYLLTRYRANKQQKYLFTYEQIKTYIGLGQSRSTDYIISDILVVLKKLGLINYEEKVEFDKESGTYKTLHYIIDISNKIIEDSSC